MCGKFTAMVSWAQIVAFSNAFVAAGGVGKKDGSDGGDGETSKGETGEIATYRVNGLLPVIVWDKEADGGAGARKVVAMRWGFPDGARQRPHPARDQARRGRSRACPRSSRTRIGRCGWARRGWRSDGDHA